MYAQCLFQASLGEGNFPKNAYKPPFGCQIVCSKYFIRPGQINCGKFLSVDNKRRKLLVVEQSEGCKFMPKLHQNAPPGPAGEFMRSPTPCSRGSYISRLLERLPRTSQTTVAFCRTLAVAHCGPTPMTCGSCLCREHITNSVIGVSRPPVLDCGTTFHLDSGGRDLPSTLSDNL